MININYGHNKELLDACKPLKEYSWLVDTIISNQKKTGSLEKAVDIAIDQMEKDAVIRPFLIKNRAEVKNMFVTEYDEARTIAEERADAYGDGYNEGVTDNQISTARNMLEKELSDDTIIFCTGISPENLKKLKKERN